MLGLLAAGLVAAVATAVAAIYFGSSAKLQRKYVVNVKPVMPAAFGAMDDVELKAIWAFLKTMPAAAAGAR